MLTAYCHTEQRLLERIAQNDTEAFTLLFHLYKNKVYALALKISGSEFQAEEAVQTIFMKIWLKRTDLTDIKNFSAWLNTVISNHLFSILKRRVAREKKEVALEKALNLTTTDTDHKILHSEIEVILNSAIDTLPTQQNKVYRLIKVHGLKREEVATHLNLSAETVKVHLSKAIKNIRDYCVNHLDILLLYSIFLYKNQDLTNPLVQNWGLI